MAAILAGCSSIGIGGRPETDVRPVEFERVLPCGAILPVFIADPNFLLGYTLQEPTESWLPDQLVWRSPTGPKVSGKQGETRSLVYKREHFGGLQASFKKLIEFNFKAGDLRAIEITLKNIIIETLPDVELVSPDINPALRRKPYVRTLVGADQIEIVAIRAKGAKADFGFYKELVPLLKLPGVNYTFDDKKGSVVLAKRVYFQACTSSPEAVLDVTKNPLKLLQPEYKDEFRVQNLMDKELNWVCNNFPSEALSISTCEGTISPRDLSKTIKIERPLRVIYHSDQATEYTFWIMSNDPPYADKEIKVITDNEFLKKVVQTPEAQ